MVGTLAFCGVIIFAHHRMNYGGLTVGDFIRFVGALALFMDPVRKFSQANIKLSQAAAADERIQQVLTLLDEVDEGDINQVVFEKNIEIKNLSFSYEENGPVVVKNFSLKINKGDKIAIVGLSGSGKTTIINILLGALSIFRGLDHNRRRRFKTTETKCIKVFIWSSLARYFLFNDSIESNLQLGESFDFDKIEEALNVAHAGDFINELSEKTKTVVGDRGMKLSGGQQQRLTIARAYLHNAPILLFDEATSALDNESEKVVQKALEKLEGDKTVLAVAHRLTTIQHYDQIYVMKNGEVIEQGKHTNLMQNDGEYAKLYSLSTVT